MYSQILKSLKAEHRLRRIPDEAAGLDLVSNDYMGLGARYAEFLPEFRARFADAPMSASASRLLQRSQYHHNTLEEMLASLYTAPSGPCAEKKALLFNSGYHANVGALSALSIPGTLIVSDKLAHASMIDGIRLGKGETARFPHNDMAALRRILERKAPPRPSPQGEGVALTGPSPLRGESEGGFGAIIVVTESVFSMDGDRAPLRELVELKREFPNVLIYLDEAHAFGVMGERGLGLAEAEGLLGEIDIIVGTLGKAAAGSGAFIVTSPMLREYLLNCARSFIFSTALPPAVIAWDTLMIEKLLAMGEERRALAELAGWFRGEIEKVTGRSNPSRSHIVPVHAGSAARAIEMADALRAAGIDALPIRRPTVAAGTERLRLSLSASLTRDELERVLDILSNGVAVQECFA